MTTVLPTLRVAALPRDANPYQSLLYSAMQENGVEVTYLGELTPSRSLNLLLLPAEVLVRGRRGLDIVHLHWVFGFRLPGRHRVPVVGLLSEAWFRVFLRTVSATGVRLAWTAHNVLPHSPVFGDDVRGRRALVSAADLVIAHSQATLEELAVLGIRPRASAIVPHGPFSTTAAENRSRDTEADRPLTLVFVGAVARYKGVEDLVAAFGSLEDRQARLIVAGRCTDPNLARRLNSAAMAEGSGIELRLHRLTDVELDDLLHEADVLVLPYREATTSGVAVLGFGAGLPLVVPNLPGLSELPSAAVFRYNSRAELAETLAQVIATPLDELRAMGSSGRASVSRLSWAEIAEITTRLLRGLVERREAVP